MRCPRRDSSRNSSAERKPGVPMRSVVTKNCPRQPRRSSAAAASSAEAPPSSKLIAACGA
jgi:hypothetical protein